MFLIRRESHKRGELELEGSSVAMCKAGQRRAVWRGRQKRVSGENELKAKTFKRRRAKQRTEGKRRAEGWVARIIRESDDELFGRARAFDMIKYNNVCMSHI